MRIQLFSIKPYIRDLHKCETMPLVTQFSFIWENKLILQNDFVLTKVLFLHELIFFSFSVNICIYKPHRQKLFGILDL